MIRLVDDLTSSAAPSLTLQQFYDQYYVPMRFPGREDSATAEDYRVQIRRLNAYQRSRGGGPVYLDDLSDHLLAGAVAWQIQQGRKAPTANKLGRTISAIWRFARRHKLLAGDGPQIDKLPELQREPECWSMEEMQRVIDAAERLAGRVGRVQASVFWPALLWTVMNTGCRITSVMHSPTAKLDLDGGWIKVAAENQKHRKDMVFDLLPETRAALTLLDPVGRGLARIFDDWPWDRTRRGWRALNASYRQILEAAELPTTQKDLWHKIRRTFATYIAAKAGEAVAQSMLGHSSISVTRRYLDQRKLDRPSVAALLAPSSRQRLKIHVPTAGG